MKTIIHKQSGVSLAIKKDDESVDINNFSTPAVYKLEDIEVVPVQEVPSDWHPFSHIYENGEWTDVRFGFMDRVRMANPEGIAIIIH